MSSKKKKPIKFQEGGIVSKEVAEKLGMYRCHDHALPLEQLGKYNTIEDIKAIQKLIDEKNFYNPLGKIKLTEVMKKRLFGKTEPISIGFKKKLTTESVD